MGTAAMAPAAMASATAECAAMDRMKAFMPLMPEMTAIVPPPMPAVRIVEVAVTGPIAVIEWTVIPIIESVIGDRLAHHIGAPAGVIGTRLRAIGRSAACEHDTGRQGHR